MPKIIVPHIVEPVAYDLPLIFLAGPIINGNDWQAVFIEYLRTINSSVQVACPCPWTQAHEELGEFIVHSYKPVDSRVYAWQQHYFDLAAKGRQTGCVVVWFPEAEAGPELFSTCYQVGKLIAWKKLLGNGVRCVFGGNADFPGLDEILYDLKDADRGRPLHFYRTMGALASAAMKLACS